MFTKTTPFLILVTLLAMSLAACSSAEDAAPSTSPAAEVATSLPATEQTTEQPTEQTREQPTVAASEDSSTEESTTTSGDPVSFQMDAWADNWFAAYLDETLLVEDSVSINTERSFNAESVTFSAAYPLHLNFILKDFKENDTGLEYIGANNQQMGDGGFIMQLTDTSTGNVVAVSDSSFACLVIHEAPLDKACENEANPVAGTAPCEFIEIGEPDGWKSADFDDSAWTATTIHSASAVSPKQGYDNISWASAAQFIWGPDLETDNTLLCRVTISGE